MLSFPHKWSSHCGGTSRMGLEPQMETERGQKKEFSSRSMAAENPMTGDVFSVQQLLSTPAAM